MQDKDEKNIQISEVAKRIERFIQETGLKQREFAEKIGIGTGRLSNVLKGRNKPDFDFVSNMAKKFRNVNTDWLLTGMGDMLLSTYTQAPLSTLQEPSTPKLQKAPKEETTNKDLLKRIEELVEERTILKYELRKANEKINELSAVRTKMVEVRTTKLDEQ